MLWLFNSFRKYFVLCLIKSNNTCCENGGIDNTFGTYKDRQHLFFHVLTANILCCKILHKNGKLQKQSCLFLLATSTIFSSFLPTKYQLHKLYHKCRSYYEFCYEPSLLGACTWIIGHSHQTQILSAQSDLKEDKQSFGTQIRRGTQSCVPAAAFLVCQNMQLVSGLMRYYMCFHVSIPCFYYCTLLFAQLVVC